MTAKKLVTGSPSTRMGQCVQLVVTRVKGAGYAGDRVDGGVDSETSVGASCVFF